MPEHYRNLYTINDLNSSTSEWTPGVKVESHWIIHLDTRIFHLTIKSLYAHVHCAMLEALTPWLAFCKFSNPNCP